MASQGYLRVPPSSEDPEPGYPDRSTVEPSINHIRGETSVRDKRSALDIELDDLDQEQPRALSQEDSRASHSDLGSEVNGEVEVVKISTWTSRRILIARARQLWQQGDAWIERWKAKHDCQGWRFGVLGGCAASAIVLLCNDILVIVGTTRDGGYVHGIARIDHGDAGAMSRLSTGLHIVLNVLSSLLLSASNYTMQVLSAPTRADIDRAHSRRVGLNIGVLSTRNVWKLGGMRTTLWCILAFSSVPLHLFYNSAIFSVTRSNVNNVSRLVKAGSELHISLNGSESNYWNLSSTQWTDIYGAKATSEHGDLYLIIDALRLEFDTDGPTQQALSDARMLPILTSANATNGTATELPVWSQSGGWVAVSPQLDAHTTNAYSEKSGGGSSVEISLIFMVIVISCNALKLTAMLWTFFNHDCTSIVTIGDAIASFLATPDTSTVGLSVLSKRELIARLGGGTGRKVQDYEYEEFVSNSNGYWLNRHVRYLSAVGGFQRGFLLVMALAPLGAPLIYAYGGIFPNSWGTSDSTVLPISDKNYGAKSTLTNAVLANAPQFVLSIAYFVLNSICTAMATTYEFNRFGKVRKGLRTTAPVGEQRSTYFLQLPYRWAIPLLATSTLLHWLLSQSFFMIRRDQFDHGTLVNWVSACGFSGLSFMIFTIVFTFLVLTITVTSFRKLTLNVPFAVSSSLVISAACHPEIAIEAREKVQWGVVKHTGLDASRRTPYCSFSVAPVERPVENVQYF